MWAAQGIQERLALRRFAAEEKRPTRPLLLLLLSPPLSLFHSSPFQQVFGRPGRIF